MISEIIKYRQEKPHETLQSIADHFKVSKPYIHKVLKTIIFLQLEQKLKLWSIVYFVEKLLLDKEDFAPVDALMNITI